jgi:ATP phosphoribosyltransferase regulatory subunit
MCVTVFAPGHHEELGRGGRYLSGEQEPATGLTLYPDTVLRARTAPAARRRVYLPWGTTPAAGAALREAGFATVAALDDVADGVAEARRLGCTHIAEGGTAVPV